MTPRTSVVVPSRGGAHRLPVLFAALRTQADPDFEVVVVLDGDVDDSRSVVDGWADELPLRVVELAENRGRAGALNVGFQVARGEVLVRCDDDLVPDPDYVAGHARHHTGAAGGPADPRGVVGLYRNEYPETAYARAYGRAWDGQFRAEAYRVPADVRWRYWAGNVSVSRETWRRVGEYDVRFRGYGWEDVDWGFRLAQLGVPIVLDPRLETPHRIAATTTADRVQRAFHSGAARRLWEGKHGLLAADGPPSSVWSTAVQLAARWHPDEARMVRSGRAVDRAIPHLPQPVARKLVALLVEAASSAGHEQSATVATRI